MMAKLIRKCVFPTLLHFQRKRSKIHVCVCVCVYVHAHVGVHACVHVLATQSCLTLCDPVDYSPPGSSVHGILQERIVEWIPSPFSRGSSQLRDRIPSPASQVDSLPSEPPEKSPIIYEQKSNDLPVLLTASFHLLIQRDQVLTSSEHFPFPCHFSMLYHGKQGTVPNLALGFPSCHKH